MKNKRIVIVANSTWNIYKFRLNVIKRLIEFDNEVIVIAPLDEYISYKESFPKVKHISLKNLSRNYTHPFSDVKAIFELRAIYKRLKPDIVIHYTHKANIYGGFAALLSKTTSVAVVTGLGYAFLHKGFINFITRVLYKLVRPAHKKIIFENDDDMALFITKKLVKADQATYVNGCGVDTAVYLPIAEPKEKKEKIIFTFIGRLLYDKGILEFVAAAEQLTKNNKHLEFWVIGELDEENPSMVEKSKFLQWIDQDYIKYHGFIDDVRPYIAQSNCVVLPSYREGMPRIILEALSMAKPVITTDTAGCRQTVEHGKNGYLVKARDIEDLVGGINKFLKLSPEEQELMGVNGREMAIKNFNSEKISMELYEIVSQVYFCT